MKIAYASVKLPRTGYVILVEAKASFTMCCHPRKPGRRNKMKVKVTSDEIIRDER